MFSLNKAATRRRLRRQRLLLLSLSGLALAVGICSGSKPGATTVRAQEKGAAASKTAPQDKGDFKVLYSQVKNKEYLELESAFKESKLFEEINAGMNETLALPHDITLEFKECGEINAFYNPETHHIELCYEMIENSANLFKDDEKTEDAMADAVLGSTIWTYFHELGHSLVDAYDLPITGKEEDAVDQLSTYILINIGEEGEEMALKGAREFYLEAKRDNDLDDSKFADSHSLDKQRFYNIICWVYGQNPAKHASLTKDGTLPEGRKDECESEYQQIAKSWGKLLEPHIKP